MQVNWINDGAVTYAGNLHEKEASICLQISRKNQKESILLRLPTEIRCKIYELVLPGGEDHHGAWWSVSCSYSEHGTTMEIEDELFWTNDKYALTKTCRQIFFDTRDLIFNPDRDHFEFWGTKSLHLFNRIYPISQLTSFYVVVTVDLEPSGPGGTHSSELDMFVKLSKGILFPSLDSLELKIYNEWWEYKARHSKDWSEYKLKMRTIIKPYLDRLRLVFLSRSVPLDVTVETLDWEEILRKSWQL